MMMRLLDDAVRAGARTKKACAVIGLSSRTMKRWRTSAVDGRRGPSSPPANRLSAAQRAKVLSAVNSAKYRDLSPHQIVPLLADEGTFLASESTIYRLLRASNLLRHRERSRPRSERKPKEHVAIAPNRVWSWDITYLKSTIRGAYFYLYLAVDIFSRKIVGWEVHDEERADLSASLIAKACDDEHVDPGALALHADNGGPMKGSTMLATLQRLGVAASFSRPNVSDDNPFSEALFRTLKYHRSYPNRPFATLEHARIWVASFVGWYNDAHLHSGLRFVSPNARHARLDDNILALRRAVYAAARAMHPERWTGATRNWRPVGRVYLNPAVRKLRGHEGVLPS